MSDGHPQLVVTAVLVEGRRKSKQDPPDRADRGVVPVLAGQVGGDGGGTGFMGAAVQFLSARGFVTPQPHRRPHASYVRFQAEQPNERSQTDITHWQLADGTDVEILNWLDDHSRLALASTAAAMFTAPGRR